jgi:predicted transcriptional regulator
MSSTQSSERERCPSCSNWLWYPTDRLGRVIGYCDPCAKPVHPTPTLVTDRERSATAAKLNKERTHIRLEETLAFIVAHPGTSSRALITHYAGQGLGDTAVYKMVAMLVQKGRVRKVWHREIAAGTRSHWTFYPVDAKDIVETQTRHDLLAETIDSDPTRWWTPQELSEATTIPAMSIYSLLSSLTRQGLIRRRTVKQRARYTSLDNTD